MREDGRLCYEGERRGGEMTTEKKMTGDAVKGNEQGWGYDDGRR